jgi:predicted LPLAT superfamily acyltransferase
MTDAAPTKDEPANEPASTEPRPAEREAAGAPSAPVEAEWLTMQERGGALAIRLTVFLTTFFGRAFGRLVARFVTFYYLVTTRRVRESLRLYYRRLDGHEASFGELYAHLFRFVACTLDAFFLVSGKTKYFEVTRDGHEILAGLRDRKQGAILLGAHVGSFYAMRMASKNESLPVYALMYTKNARMLNEALARLDPEGRAQVLELDPEGGIDAMIKVKELVDRGAIIAILADRVPLGAPPERVMRVPFLDAEAAFPLGPFLLASTLKCPVYTTFGLSRGTHRYDLNCHPFAERVELPRKDRKAALERYVRLYAERLEEAVKKAPDNWFNFYDFWK